MGVRSASRSSFIRWAAFFVEDGVNALLAVNQRMLDRGKREEV